MKKKITIGQLLKAIFILLFVAFVVTWIVLSCVHNVSPAEEFKSWLAAMHFIKNSTPASGV